MFEIKVGDSLYMTHGGVKLIVGETKVSWLLKSEASWVPSIKISKKAIRELGHDGAHYPTLFVNKELAEDYHFMREEHRSVADAVRAIRDPKLLRKVADLIGYKGKAVTND